MTLNRYLRLMSVTGGALLIFMVMGCSGLAQPYPARAQFAIIVPPMERVESTRAGALRIERVQVTPPSDGRFFLYRTSDSAFRSDYYNGFIAPPERLLSGSLLRALVEGGAFESIVEPGSASDADIRLECTVNDLYGDFRVASKPLARVRARFVLLEESLDATRQVSAWSFEADEPIPSASASDLADGFGRAWARILDQLLNELGSVRPATT